jgi:putative phage-type endonuclease
MFRQKQTHKRKGIETMFDIQLNDHQVQNSASWHEFRSKHIGASEVPAIMGTSDFQSIYQLWLVKTGLAPKFEGNWATRRGQEYEPIIREAYIQKTGFTVVDKVLEYPDWPILSASLDGWVDSESLVVEIKFPSKAKHQQALLGIVPETYRDQLQTQMLVSGADHADYVSYSAEENDDFKLAIVRVKADKTRQTEILNAAQIFWGHVTSNTPPIDIAEQPELYGDIIERQSIKEQIKALEAKEEALADKIKLAMRANTVVCDKFKITWSERKGSVEYAKIPELKGLDLEKYRKAPTKVFTIK